MRFILLLMFSSVFFNVSAQYTVSGTLINTESNLPISASVAIDVIDIATNADENGVFKIVVPEAGDYILVVKNAGQTIHEMPISVKADTDLGMIKVNPNATNEDLVIPTVVLNDLEDQNDEEFATSSLLSASRDVFERTAAYTFGPARFRIRGYDSENTSVSINGAPMNELENGRVFWSAWGGLNDMFRNNQSVVGLNPSNIDFGGVGGSTNIDIRASKQRSQSKVVYSNSNRSYPNRLMVSHATGLMENGWAFAAAGSKRWGQEGYIQGNFYDGYSYFLAIDKKINNHLFSLAYMGSPTKRGSSSAAVQESYDLADDHFYNPNWGYQNGKVRNARFSDRHQPIAIFTHEGKLSDRLDWTTSLSYQFGENGTAQLDWQNARDPRPDYYRYLPSYYSGVDDVYAAELADHLRNNEDARQVNWDYLYNVNYDSYGEIENANGVAGNTVSGRQAKYVQMQRRYDSKEFNANTRLNYAMDNGMLSFGASYQKYKGENYQKLIDLLGADFYMDIDQFISDKERQQNNLLTPNRVLQEGDKYGYNYESHIQKYGTWAQAEFKLNSVDAFVAANISSTTMWRNGLYQNGKFPDNSLGESEKKSFFNYGTKAGLTYKIDGRNYVYANGSYATRAPFFRNAMQSARTRNAFNDLSNETIYSVEGGYRLQSPNFKARVVGYLTQFQNQTSVRYFFLDGIDDQQAGFLSFVQSDMDKRHFGGEFAVEAKVLPELTLTGVAAIGRHFYSNRPNSSWYLEETAQPIIEDEKLYIKNFRLPSMPQEAYTFGIEYRSPKYWFANLNLNYYNEIYLDFNTSLRTERMVDALQLQKGEDPAYWASVMNQKRMDGQFTADLFAGKSFKYKQYYAVVTLGVSNILNNQDFVTGGFEQWRIAEGTNQAVDVDRFLPRLFYGYGLNYFLNASLRF